MEDVSELVALRRVMFEAMECRDAEALDRMEEASALYFARDLPSGAFCAWLAEENGRPMGSIGLVVHNVPPSPWNVQGRQAYIVNLVTLPADRRRGIVGALLDRVLAVVRSEGIPVACLRATREGRRIYERAGFVIDEDGPEMRVRVTSPG
jgi:ribosomal protein S18 acetylase RimI-like enzyme